MYILSDCHFSPCHFQYWLLSSWQPISIHGFLYILPELTTQQKFISHRQTIISEVIVQELEQWEAIPGVWGLHLQRRIHVHREQWPEYLCMLHQ